MSTPPANLTRILLVDDHTVVREGLSILIKRQPDMVVVGKAARSAEAIEIACREQPDIILLDLALDGENSLDSLPQLIAAAPTSRVIVLTGIRDPQEHQRTVKSGAMGVVLKEQAPEVLIKAIETVRAGQVWLDASLMATVLADLTREREADAGQLNPEAAKVALLTPREREIITLVCDGLKNKQIAQRLSISETTVNHHLTSIFTKLDVPTRLELAIYAFQHGLAPTDT